MRRLNTCTRCILRTSSTLLSICRAKIESTKRAIHFKVLSTASRDRPTSWPLPSTCDYEYSNYTFRLGSSCLVTMLLTLARCTFSTCAHEDMYTRTGRGHHYGGSRSGTRGFRGAGGADNGRKG